MNGIPCAGGIVRCVPIWDAPIHTSFSTGAPVFCFYNEEGQNRLTIALSEVRLEALHSYGVHEEDGTLLCCLKLPLPMTGSAGALQRDASAAAGEYAL